MTINIKKTKTGFKFKIAAVTNNNEIVHVIVLCSHQPNVLDAEKSAYKHVTSKLINFERFPSYSDYNNLPILF